MRIGLLHVAVAGVLWGTGGLVVQLIRRDEPFSPLVLSAERMLIGAVAMLVLVALVGGVRRGLGDVVTLIRTHPVAVLVVGGSTGAYQALYFVAVTQVGVAVSTMVSLGLAPVLLAALDAVQHRRRPSALALLTLAVALLGLALVCLTSSSDLGPRPALGVALSIASGTTYAVTTLVGRRVAQIAAPTSLATASTLAGAIVLAPLLLVGGPHLPDSPAVAGWLLYLGVGTMGLAYLSLYAGLRTVPATQATLASLLEPVTAAVLAALVLDEHLSALGILGCALVLAAVGGLALEE